MSAVAPARPVSDFLSASPKARNLARLDLGFGWSAAIWANHDDHVTYEAPAGHTLSFYLRGGEGTWRRDGSPAHGWQGAVCVMPQGQSSVWDITRPFAFLHLYAPDAELRRVYAETFDRDSRQMAISDRSFVAPGQLVAPFRALLMAVRSGDAAAADCARTEVLATAFAGGFMGEARQTTVTGGLSPRHVRLLRDHIEAHLDQPLTLRSLAELVGLSEFHLQRSFAQSCGVSPQKWIAHRRIARAKQMIAGAEAPLAQVAVACGYSSQSHLSRAFRAGVGLTPGAYRQALGVSAGPVA